MSSTIERLNYYEREYLRSFDFIAEQNYHIDMRRRLNLALHLWGIVGGLDVGEGTLFPGAPKQFYISEGMAIDAHGREILLFAPYALTDDDVRKNQISAADNYKLWIAYDLKLATPPAPGFGVCDLKDQYTRWRESFRVIISNDLPSANEPKITDEISDDPNKQPWPVRLGTVTVGSVGGKLTITDAFAAERVYIGLRAQRVVAPTTPQSSQAFDATKSNSPLDAPLSIGVEANLFAEENLVVGENFPVDPGKIQPPPHPKPPAVFPSPGGNLKVASDMFIQGNIYANIAGDWLGLGEYFKSFVPEIVSGVKQIFPLPNNDPSFDIVSIPVTTKLPRVSDAKMVVALAGIEWVSGNTSNVWAAGVDNNALQRIKLEVTGFTFVQKDYDFKVRWEIGPRNPKIGPPVLLNVHSLTVSWFVVFYP
jgi:hypothetical protein